MPLFHEKLAVPAGELVHSPKAIVSVDDAQCNLKNTPVVGVIMTLTATSLQKITHEILGGALSLVLANVNWVLRLLERVPLVIPPL